MNSSFDYDRLEKGYHKVDNYIPYPEDQEIYQSKRRKTDKHEIERLALQLRHLKNNIEEVLNNINLLTN